MTSYCKCFSLGSLPSHHRDGCTHDQYIRFARRRVRPTRSGMVVLVPPSDAAGVVPGTLVQVGGLSSARGKELNRKLGVVRGTTENGRLQVEILGWRTNNALYHEDPVPIVNLKPENVQQLNQDDFVRCGLPMFVGYLRNKKEFFLVQKGPDAGITEMYEAMAELFEQPWYAPMMNEKLTMCFLLRVTGRTADAMKMLVECIGDAAAAGEDQERNHIFYEFSLCLIADGCLDEALDSILEIEEGTFAVNVYRKEKALKTLVRLCFEDSNMAEVKDRALLALSKVPRDFKTLQSIGEMMCDSRDYQVGIEYYERARMIAPENAELEEKLKYARVQLEAQQGDGTAVIGYALDANGNQAPVYYVDNATADRTSEAFKNSYTSRPAPARASEVSGIF